MDKLIRNKNFLVILLLILVTIFVFLMFPKNGDIELDKESLGVLTTDAPTEAPVEATEAPVEATEAPVEATEAPVEATEAPVEATEAPVEATEVPVEATEVPVEATEAPVEATEAPVEATEAPVEATEAPVEATEAPVEPTEAPAEPTAEPTEDTVTSRAEDKQVKAYMIVYVGTAMYEPIPLLEEGRYSIKTNGGANVNVVTVTGDSMCVTESTCPTQDCVSQGLVTLDNRSDRIFGDYIYCMAHNVTLRLVSSEELMDALGEVGYE